MISNIFTTNLHVNSLNDLLNNSITNLHANLIGKSLSNCNGKWKKGKKSRLMAITTIVSYVQLKEKKLPSTSFSLALLQPRAGSRLEFNGNMEILSSKC